MKISDHSLDNLDDLVKLSLSFYPESEISTKEYLEWEYLQNPAGEAIVTVAKDDENTVGQYIAIPVKIQHGPIYIKGSLSLNTLTKSDYQGKGLFPSMAREAFSRCKTVGVDFTFGFPNASSFGGFISKLNFKHIGNLPLYILPLNFIKAIFHFLFKGTNKRNVELDIIFNDVQSLITVLDLNVDGKSLTHFLGDFYRRNKFVTTRSVEWLKWRYVDIPIRKYTLLKETRNGVIVGIAVIRAKIISGVRTGIVVDSVVTNDSIELFPYIKKLGKKNKLDLFIFTAPEDSREVSEAKKIKFLQLPYTFMFKKLPFIIRSHKQENDKTIFEFKNWFLTFGDYDIF